MINTAFLIQYHTVREPNSSMGEDIYLIFFLTSKRRYSSLLDLDFLYLENFMRLRDNITHNDLVKI